MSRDGYQDGFIRQVEKDTCPMTHNLRDGKANKGCSIVPDIGEIQRLYTCFNFHTSLSVDRNDCNLFFTI